MDTSVNDIQAVKEVGLNLGIKSRTRDLAIFELKGY